MGALADGEGAPRDPPASEKDESCGSVSSWRRWKEAEMRLILVIGSAGEGGTLAVRTMRPGIGAGAGSTHGEGLEGGGHGRRVEDILCVVVFEAVGFSPVFYDGFCLDVNCRP